MISLCFKGLEPVNLTQQSDVTVQPLKFTFKLDNQGKYGDLDTFARLFPLESKAEALDVSVEMELLSRKTDSVHGNAMSVGGMRVWARPVDWHGYGQTFIPHTPDQLGWVAGAIDSWNTMDDPTDGFAYNVLRFVEQYSRLFKPQPSALPVATETKDC